MDPGLLDDVLSKLTAADARLLFTQTRDPIDDDPTVELSHEALIKSWKRLRDWIDENKQDLITQRRLEEATKDWLLAAKNDAYLYRGTALS